MTEFVNAYIWTRFFQKCPHNIKSILDFYRTDVVFCIRLPDSTDTKLSAISLFHFPHCYCHHLEILRYHQLSILWSPASPHSINLGDQNYDQSCEKKVISLCVRLIRSECVNNFLTPASSHVSILNLE